MTAGGEGVDLFFADEQCDIMATFGEHFTDGDAGKQVPTGATTGDEDVNVGRFCFQEG